MILHVVQISSCGYAKVWLILHACCKLSATDKLDIKRLDQNTIVQKTSRVPLVDLHSS